MIKPEGVWSSGGGGGLEGGGGGLAAALSSAGSGAGRDVLTVGDTGEMFERGAH